MGKVLGMQICCPLGFLYLRNPPRRPNAHSHRMTCLLHYPSVCTSWSCARPATHVVAHCGVSRQILQTFPSAPTPSISVHIVMPLTRLTSLMVFPGSILHVSNPMPRYMGRIS